MRCAASGKGPGKAPRNSARRRSKSHETIYRGPFFEARGVLKNELVRHLPSNG